MTVIAATTLGKVVYVLFFVVLAGGVAAYGWFKHPRYVSGTGRRKSGASGSQVSCRPGESEFFTCQSQS